MATSYKRLWKLLIDRDLKKRDLERMANAVVDSVFAALGIKE